MSWFTKVSEQGYFTPQDAVRLLHLVKQVTGIPFPTKRFRRFPARVEAEGIEFTTMDGRILVIQSFSSDIPNYQTLAEKLEGYFGDVHVRPNYINARGYGQEKTQASVSEPASMESLPEVTIPEPLNAQIVTEMFHRIKDATQARRVTVTGKPDAKLLGRIGKTVPAKIWAIGGQTYLEDVGLYWVRDYDEAQQLHKLMQIEMELGRALEVADWRHQDFSSPTG